MNSRVDTHRGRYTRTMMRAVLPAVPVLLTTTVLLALGPGDAPADMPGDGDSTVVVELFTSQGCSSCPPADRLLTALAEDPAYRGRVLPLSLHVDYWNYIGWTDPFSSAAFSDRQRDYESVWRSGRVYTPQMVLDGATDVVGSDGRKVRAAIDRALEESDRVMVSLALETAEGGLSARITASARDRLDGPRVVWAALWEDCLETPVARGENGGRKLANDRVVRILRPAFRLDEDSPSRSEALELRLDPSWDPGAIGLVAFVQDTETLRIEGAAARRIPTSPDGSTPEP